MDFVLALDTPLQYHEHLTNEKRVSNLILIKTNHSVLKALSQWQAFALDPSSKHFRRRYSTPHLPFGAR